MHPGPNFLRERYINERLGFRILRRLFIQSNHIDFFLACFVRFANTKYLHMRYHAFFNLISYDFSKKRVCGILGYSWCIIDLVSNLQGNLLLG